MPKLFFSAGDLSGDYHCSLLVQELNERRADWHITALGGKNLHQSGAEILADTSELGVIGFASAMAVLPRTFRIKSLATKWLERNRPDAAVLCDWGGFNTRILPDLKRLGIPVLFYFPPRSWQKKGEGGLAIASLCESIATPFEWSAQKLNDAGGHATWVGHPILETAHRGKSREAVRAELGVGEDEKFITILAGSRSMERKYIAPHIAGALQILKTRFEARYFVAATPGTGAALQQVFGPDVTVVEGRAFELLRACDAAIVKSGTSTLEAAVADAPQVVVYEAPALIHLQVRLTGLRKKIPFVAMPNIIMDRGIIPELLGENCRADKIADALTNLVKNREEVSRMRADYAQVREALGEKLPYTATHITADLVERLVSSAA
jgi:lipid-A-disaccharide synthase